MSDGKRFCTYCRLRKPEEGFKEIRDKQGRLRNRKCGDCSEKKFLPPHEREMESRRRNADAKEAQARRMREVTAARITKHYTKEA